MSQPIAVAEAKRRFADVLGSVRHGGARYVIERRGTPVAAIVSVDDLALIEQRSCRGALALVGAFADAPTLPDIVDEVVRGRPRQRPGARPKWPKEPR